MCSTAKQSHENNIKLKHLRQHMVCKVRNACVIHAKTKGKHEREIS